ncbi:MAG: hypothetical protein NWF14_06370 [Candidatus Bathyarchaeota archaeon]|nr:hypothetical protein [Candidatus Bathyarchaeota archaeon]
MFDIKRFFHKTVCYLSGKTFHKCSNHGLRSSQIGTPESNEVPDNHLDIPEPCALIGEELLSEGKYESLEAVSISSLLLPTKQGALSLIFT